MTEKKIILLILLTSFEYKQYIYKIIIRHVIKNKIRQCFKTKIVMQHY